MRRRMIRAVPYALVLMIGAYFFHLASILEFSAPNGRIGPEAWPEMILGCLLVTCVYEIGRILFFDRAPEPGVPPAAVMDFDGAPQDVESAGSRARVVAGVVAAIAYVFLLDELGFLLTTFFFLIVFNYLGGYRRHAVIWISSLLASILLMFVFMRIVYISLPLGVAPFSALSQAAISAMGIR